MPKHTLSTFEREMQNATFKEAFEKEYNEFFLSETIHAMMDEFFVRFVNNKTRNKIHGV